jgi:hypothetical protein
LNGDMDMWVEWNGEVYSLHPVDRAVCVCTSALGDRCSRPSTAVVGNPRFCWACVWCTWLTGGVAQQQ